MSKGEKVCIVENDYGAVNVDMVMLKDLLSDNCNLEMIVGGDGKEAHRRRFKTKLISMGMSGFTRVIVEPSGIYDVDEFFDVLYDEPLDRWYEIGSVITILDATIDKELSEKSRYILMSEAAWSGKIVVSKTDKKEPKQAVGFLNGVMEQFGCTTRFDYEKDVVKKPFGEITADEFEEIKNSGFKRASYVKLPELDNEYNSLFYFEPEIDESLLKGKVEELFNKDKYGHIIRVKGFVKTGNDEQIEINATGEGISMQPVKSSTNIIIVIGEELNKELINDMFRDYCTQVSL